jgi:protein tyrosine/serine phosphatase
MYSNPSRKVLPLLLLLPACGGVPQKASPDDPSGNFSQVSQGLYRGGRPDEAGIHRLAEMKVKTIIDLENDEKVVDQERTWATSLGMDFVWEPMTGTNRPNDQVVDQTLALLKDKECYPVFVHCMQGHDRTGVIIALHRVFNEGWTPKAAKDEMEALGFNGLLFALEDYYDQKSGMSH